MGVIYIVFGNFSRVMVCIEVLYWAERDCLYRAVSVLTSVIWIRFSYLEKRQKIKICCVFYFSVSDKSFQHVVALIRNFFIERLWFLLRLFGADTLSYSQWQKQLKNTRMEIFRRYGRWFWITSIVMLYSTAIELYTGLIGLGNWKLHSKFTAFHHSGVFLNT